MKVLIIGLGSIAKKHIQALKNIRQDVQFYALRSGVSTETHEGISSIASLDECPEVDFIIISNPTALHADAIRKCASLKKPLFIEKPPFHNLEPAAECLSLVNKYKIPTYTAFNLRFLDCLKYLKANAGRSRVQEVNVYCGSYLPSWRGGADHTKSYSSDPEMGGGVHLDLIHEVDYIRWIFGNPIGVRSTLRNSSGLGIKAVDYANYVLSYKDFAVNIILNYYRRDARRTCEILFDDTTWLTDVFKNSITDLKDSSIVFQSEQIILDTYTAQMDYFCSAIAADGALDNQLSESIHTLKIALS